MKIKSCEIKNFGKLSDKTVDLSDGITVIRGGNESGKSTLSAFIKYVLYGFSGKGRDERNNEKLRYTPWNGLKCSGALIIEDEEHTLFRAERSADGKVSKGKILNSQGSECFEGFDAGEVFFGADASAFTKSSFVGQDDIEPDDMKELGTSLERLLMKSENDDADFEKASKNLTAERNRLYNKMRSTGKIFELEQQISELREKRISQSENNKQLNASEFAASETEKNLHLTNMRLEKLYEESENIAAYKASELLEKINGAKERYDSLGKLYSDTLNEYSVNGFTPDRDYLLSLERANAEYMNSLPQHISAEKELENIKLQYNAATAKIHSGNSLSPSADTDDTEVNEILVKAREIASQMKKYKSLAMIFACLIVTLPIAAIIFVMYSKKKKSLEELLGKYGFASMDELEKFAGMYSGVFASLSSLRKETERKEELLRKAQSHCDICAENLLSLAEKCGKVNREDLDGIGSVFIPDIRLKVYELERIFSEYQKAKNTYEAHLSASDPEELAALAAKKRETPPMRPKEEVDRAIKYDEGAKALLTKKLTEYKTDIARLGAVVTDAAEIESEIHRLEKELAEAKLNTDALELALEIIERSAQDIRGNVFPKISERAGKLFSDFTGGKYRSLSFDKDFAVKVLEENDTETRKIGYLSSGAIDTAYIALRVALAEYLCKNKPTLIFDDSFAKIDDSRLSNILDVLLVLSREYQIVILTCHDREEKILGQKCKTVILDTE